MNQEWNDVANYVEDELKVVKCLSLFVKLVVNNMFKVILVDYIISIFFIYLKDNFWKLMLCNHIWFHSFSLQKVWNFLRSDQIFKIYHKVLNRNVFENGISLLVILIDELLNNQISFIRLRTFHFFKFVQIRVFIRELWQIIVV